MAIGRRAERTRLGKNPKGKVGVAIGKGGCGDWRVLETKVLGEYWSSVVFVTVGIVPSFLIEFDNFCRDDQISHWGLGW